MALPRRSAALILIKSSIARFVSKITQRSGGETGEAATYEPLHQVQGLSRLSQPSALTLRPLRLRGFAGAFTNLNKSERTWPGC